MFQDASIDLDQVASSNGLTLTDGFQIRFQFSDAFSFNPDYLDGSDGYLIDDVELSCDCSSELTGESLGGPDPVVVESACVIVAGPAYTVASGGNLVLRSSRGVLLRDGFSVLAGGKLSVEHP